MTALDVQQISGVCAILLFIWELVHKRVLGALLSGVAAVFLLFVSTTAANFVAMAMAVPVVFEERWNPRAQKDLVRAALAAAIIAVAVGWIVVYSG